VSDGTDLRAEFLLDPSVRFLNHGSFGACPRPVLERYQGWQLELERQPVLFLARRLKELLADARAALGAYVGADPDDLVFVPNATAGVNVVARGLGLQSGDVIVQLNRTPIVNAETVNRIITNYGRGGIRMYFERGGQIYATEFSLQ